MESIFAVYQLMRHRFVLSGCDRIR